MNEQVGDTTKQVANQGMEHLLNNPFVVFLGKLALALATFVFFIFLSKAIAGIIKKKIINNTMIGDEEYVSKIANLVGDVIFYILLIFDVIIAFQILGFDLGILLGGLSFGLGFAFKEILGNMLSGILILTTKDYTLGDLIKIEGNPGYFGYIEEITIRYTVIREFNNQKIILPNLTFITSPIKTYTSEEFVRLEALVSVHYDTDLDKARKIIIEAVNKVDFVVNKEHTNVITEKFDDSGINLKVWFYVDPNGNVGPANAISHINEVIYNTLKENDITIPYPHTVVTVDKNDQNLLKSLLLLKK